MVEQSIPPSQIVIVCDGPIGTELERVINNFSENYPQLFTIVRLPKNYGLAYALNIGISKCKYELIARMDSDDYSHKDRCKKQLEAFEKDPQLELLGTCVKNFRDTPENVLPLSKTRPLDNESIKKVLRRSSPFAHPSVMYKKDSVVRCGGYDPSLRRRQDYDLFSRMVVSNNCKSANLAEALLHFRAEDDFVVRNKNLETCKARIEVQKRILKRKECSFGDFLYIWAAMMLTMILPNKLYGKIYSIIKSRKG
jgi:glycosyltransferase involved in cell wall biosynthesis